MDSKSLLSSGRYNLDYHRIIHSDSGEVVLAANRRAEKNDRYYRELRDENREYFAAPKYIGAVRADKLIETANRNLSSVLDEDVDDQLRSEKIELAASALQEVSLGEVLMNGVDINSVDVQLDRLDYADELLENAILSLGAEHTTIKQRLVVKRLFHNVMKDIICGEVTEQTVAEVIEDLTDQLYKTYNNTDAVHSRGLAGEIHAFLDIWKGYQAGKHDFIGIPATVRGDSGFYRRNETHDIDTLEQYGSTWINRTPQEVKRRRITGHILRRYTNSDIVYINPIGQSSLEQEASV